MESRDEPVVRELNLNQQLGYLHAEINSAIEYTAVLSRHGAFAQPLLVADPPSEFLFRVGSPDSKMATLGRDQFTIEVIRYCVVFVVAHWDRYLVALHSMKAVLDRMAESGSPRIQMSAVNETVAAVHEAHRHASLTRQLSRLHDEDEAIASGERWFSGFYSLRNCIVHRGGLVDAVADSDLVRGIVWRRAVFLRNDEELIDDGTRWRLEGGEELRFQIRDEDRNWAPGTHVALTAREFQEAAFAMMILAQALKTHVLNYAAAIVSAMKETEQPMAE